MMSGKLFLQIVLLIIIGAIIMAATKCAVISGCKYLGVSCKKTCCMATAATTEHPR